MELLGNLSDENLVRLTYLGEKLTSDEECLAGIAGVRQLLHGSKPILPSISSDGFSTIYLLKTVESSFETLFYRAWFLGGKKRDQFEAEHGFWPPFVISFHPPSIATSAVRDATP